MINNDWSKEDEMTTDFNNRQYDEMYRSTSFIIDSLCHILPVDRTYNVIDVGTGAGANLYYIAKEYQNHNFIGVDFNDHYLQQAEDRHRELGLKNTKFRSLDIFDPGAETDFGDIGCDVIGSSQVLNIIEFERGKQFIGNCFNNAKVGVFFHSLFTERPLDYDVKIHDHTVDAIVSMNIYSIFTMNKLADQCGFHLKYNKEFEIDVDLPNKFEGRGTYTTKTSDDKRMQFTDVLYCPWRFLYYERN
tara:strand:+ start:11066 stop:11803 length:738 start_codon:yes stop_codon:yes gene_type:complete